MILLALDLGTKTGWACGDAPDAKLVLSGTERLRKDGFDSYGMLGLRFEELLSRLHAQRRFDRVAYEAVRAHKGTKAAHVYGGLLMRLQQWCDARAIPYEGVEVGHIKRFATGKGNCSKEAVIAAVRSWGYGPQDDNHADSLALFHGKIMGAL